MSAQCPHLLAASSHLQPPRFSTPVYRDECTQCFDGDTDEDGIDVCLTCYNGGCPRIHAQAHADKLQGHGHDVVLNIRKTRKPKDIQSAKRTSGEPPFKRLAIREELPEHERYDFHTSLKCYGCGGLQIQGNEQTDAITATVLSSVSSSQKSDVKAWQEEIQSCSHSKDLIQEASKQLEQSGLAHCSQCELTNNLWLCLTCGGLSCGRQQFGGVGGNGHALAHYSATRHPVSVKLGTIEPDGSADVYCYACDEERTDPSLSAHLAHWGIHIATQTKTEKSLTELQVEQNLKFDFSMTGEDGKDLEPLFGPGLTGMANLGNSCYMASVLQTLFALPEFADRYFTKGSAHALLCSNPAPASCFECQMSKVGDGLLSGRYAVPRAGDADADATAEHYAPAGSEVLEPASASQPVPAGTHVNRPFQAGIRPSMFKALVGKDHEEFKTMRQQDAEEFFRHLVGMIQRQSRNAGASSGGGAGGGGGSGGDGEDAPLDPTRVFQFEMEERLQCTVCKGVRYKTVAEETLSLPVPFVPKTAGASAAAMEIDESAPAGTSEGKGKAPIEGENAAPPAAAAPAASMGTAGPASDAKDKEEWEPVQIEECLKLLTSSATIEYKCPKCDKNVHANKSTRFATFPDTLVVHATRFRLHNWVPQKVDVPILISSGPLSLDKYLGTGQQEGEELLPEDTSASTASAIEFNATAMAQLEGMGFPSVRAQKALLATGNTGDADAAMNWLFAHMEDADIDDPIPAAQLQVSSAAGTTGASAGAAGASAEQIAALAEMGFTPNQARKALRETGGSADAAVEWLFSHPDDAGEAEGEASAEASSSPTGAAEPRGSRALPAEYRLKAFISHRGPSAASGHYVAHVHLPQVGWVFFNDEKVVGADGGAQAAINLIPHAYLYVFEKVQPTVAA